MNTMPRVGFIGLGAMGGPMASCILQKGYPLLGYDLSPDRMAQFQKQHATQASEVTSPIQTIGKNVDVLVMILPNSRVVEDVLFGPTGVADQLAPKSLIVDMTSGVPSQTCAMEKKLAALDIGLIDAPVSGAVARAQNGSLTIMVGGRAEWVEQASPILEAMGSIVMMGAIGSGHAMKALNNLVSSAGFLIGIEALIIGSKFGLNPEVMVDVLNASTGMNNSTQKKFRQYVLSGRFDTGAPLKMMLKDIEIALGLAQEMNVPAPFARLCLDMWTITRNMLGPDVDHTAMVKGIEKLSGWEIPKTSTNKNSTN